MSDAIDDAMTVTMDRQGRIVVPKAIREEFGVPPGTPLRIRTRDGVIQIQPVPVEYRIVERDGLRVAEPVEPVPPISHQEVRKLIVESRERRKRWW